MSGEQAIKLAGLSDRRLSDSVSLKVAFKHISRHISTASFCRLETPKFDFKIVIEHAKKGCGNATMGNVLTRIGNVTVMIVAKMAVMKMKHG